jgi:nucleoside-diphosphate-sugar epimerase
MDIVTGGFGLLGTEVVLRLIRKGRRVLVLEHPRNCRPALSVRRLIRSLSRSIGQAAAGRLLTVLPCDFSKEDEPQRTLDLNFDRLFPGVVPRSVLHCAALIPPAADRRPAYAEKINIAASSSLIAWVRKRCPETPVVYTSSISVYGDRRGTPPIAVGDPLRPSPGDEYAVQKAAAEDLFRSSGLPWRILRMTYLVSAGKLSPDPLMFEMPLNTHLEVCHIRDASAAVVSAAGCPDADRRIFNIAGGPSCRTGYREYLYQMFTIFGLAPAYISEGLFSTSPFHCGYMDTSDSQAVLRYQHTSLLDYYMEVYRKKNRLRPFIRLFRGIVWRRILKGSEYFQSLDEGVSSRIMVSLMKRRISS